MSEEGLNKHRTLIDLVFKVLSVAVIPVFVWVVKLEVTNALQDERIGELQQDVAKTATISQEVRETTTALVKLETRLDIMGKNLDEIKRLLATQ